MTKHSSNPYQQLQVINKKRLNRLRTLENVLLWSNFLKKYQALNPDFDFESKVDRTLEPGEALNDIKKHYEEFITSRSTEDFIVRWDLERLDALKGRREQLVAEAWESKRQMLDCAKEVIPKLYCIEEESAILREEPLDRTGMRNRLYNLLKGCWSKKYIDNNLPDAAKDASKQKGGFAKAKAQKCTQMCAFCLIQTIQAKEEVQIEFHPKWHFPTKIIPFARIPSTLARSDKTL